MRIQYLAMGAIFLLLLAGCASRPDEVWQRQHCLNDRRVCSQLPGVYAAMNLVDHEARDKKFGEYIKRSSDSSLVLLVSKIAYDFGFVEEQRDFMTILRHFNPATIERGDDGKVYNSCSILGRTDWVSLDATLTRQRTRPADDASGSQPRGVYTFTLPANTTFDARFFHAYNDLTLSGSIDLTTPEPGTPVAEATPTRAVLVVGKNGNNLRLTLDPANPFNTLRLDPQGHGVLGMALKVESDARDLAGVVYVGSTIYVEIPVEVNEAFTRLRLASSIFRPGNELTPASATTLLAADGPFHKMDVKADAWADSNANGILDGADAILWLYATDLKDRLWPGF